MSHDTTGKCGFLTRNPYLLLDNDMSDKDQFKRSKNARNIILVLWDYVIAILQKILIWILKCGPLPDHVAIIMDGNRRFADKLKIQRNTGHLYGYDRLIKTIELLHHLGVNVLSVYAFSIDNFKRTPSEVTALMDLLQEKLEDLSQNDTVVKKYEVRVRIVGKLSLLPKPVQEAALTIMSKTESNKGPILNVCVPYTSREELTAAMQSIFEERSLSIQHRREVMLHPPHF